MVIDLLPPFSNCYRKGYLSINPEGRRIIALYNSSTDRRTMSYARYLKSVELGYEIPEGIEVDHADNDKTNDAIGNLQLLTKMENVTKDFSRRESKYKSCTLVCCECGVSYDITAKQHAARVANKTVLDFCSMRCSGTYHYKRNAPPTKKIDISEFEELVKSLKSQGMSDRKISETTGLSRHSVRLVRKVS